MPPCLEYQFRDTALACHVWPVGREPKWVGPLTGQIHPSKFLRASSSAEWSQGGKTGLGGHCHKFWEQRMSLSPNLSLLCQVPVGFEDNIYLSNTTAFQLWIHMLQRNTGSSFDVPGTLYSSGLLASPPFLRVERIQVLDLREDQILCDSISLSQGETLTPPPLSTRSTDCKGLVEARLSVASGARSPRAGFPSQPKLHLQISHSLANTKSVQNAFQGPFLGFNPPSGKYKLCY